MRWTELYDALYPDPRKTASLCSMMWQVAAEWPDDSVAVTLQGNLNTDRGIADSLDWRGIPVPQAVLQHFDPGPPPDRSQWRSIFGSGGF